MHRVLAPLAALAVLAAPHPSAALFHLAVISEVMTSYDGDANVQFVEIETLSGLQTLTTNSVLAAFDAAGVYQGDILVVPGPIANSANGTKWIMGTAAFETESGLTVNFEFAPGLIQTSGMICWGGGPGAIVPEDPPDWDRTVPANYVDCVSYGAYTGPANVHTDAPTPLSPDGHSLQRVSETHSSLDDFVCGASADPENNAGETATLAATTPCPVAPTPLTKGQAKCLDKLHAGANGVAKAADAIVRSCVSGFAKGKVASALTCVNADAAGKVAKAEAKTLAAETKFCAAANLPLYGSAGGAAWNEGGREASSFFLFELFEDAVKKGSLDDTLVTNAVNADVAKCQTEMVAQGTKAVEGVLKASQRIAKGLLAGKAGPAPTTPEALAEALVTALLADAKVDKLEQGVRAGVAKRCTPPLTGFVGAECGAAATGPELGGCVFTTGACTACLGVESGSGLDLDCQAIGGPTCEAPSS